MCPSQEQLESKKDIFVATETGEEPCISDRQNESGNEQSIAPPVNCTKINAFLTLGRVNHEIFFFSSPRFRETRNDGWESREK